VLVVLVAAVLVLGVRWLGAGDDGPAATDQAGEQSGADGRAGTAAAPATGERDAGSNGPAGARPVATTLRPAKGVCDVADVAVVPDVVDAHTGGPVPQRLLALELVSGEDLIWRASACPDALEPQTLTLRRGWITYVEVNWNGRRGTEDCLPTNDLAKPGYYWAEAAVIGGEPERSQFRLTTPPPPEPSRPAASRRADHT
jgi:hypothetical protein